MQLLFPDKESKTEDLEVDLKSQAERRKSCLDHHWAIPSKDRYGDACLSVCLSVVAPAHLSTQKKTVIFFYVHHPLMFVHFLLTLELCPLLI